MKNFISKSEKVQHIIKSFNLTKTLFVSSIIIGEKYTGKKTLAKYLFPDAVVVSGVNQEEVTLALESYDEIIIVDFEKLTNTSLLDFNNKRIIAIANYMGNASAIDELFAFIYIMPPLRERPEDIAYLKTLFIEESCETLMLQKEEIHLENVSLDLSMNSKSLKKSIFLALSKFAMNHTDIQEILYHYLLEHLDGNDAYSQYLELYEKPLIEAGLTKYGSQLQLSKILGINRNTLRKKIHEHNINSF
ncbi:MAG: Fis family transcriptional regulator [Sulfurovum sp.]|nr:MAG: Fis family transcriptional regulator [Sulfurovum sp.]